jgi:hypothetical protein
MYALASETYCGIVCWESTYVSKEYIASIFRVE